MSPSTQEGLTSSASLAKMSELEELGLYDNSLTGSIHPGVWDLKKLQQLDVSMNSLTGDMVVGSFVAMNLTRRFWTLAVPHGLDTKQ